LKEKTNWTDSDELKLLFTNTYSPAFYKKLHRHVHHEFRRQQGLVAIRKISRRPLSTSFKDCKRALVGFLFVPRIFVERLQLKLYA
jgi:anaerobic magnesium-protoporphyrin IX monomethyl ester cyclase